MIITLPFSRLMMTFLFAIFLRFQMLPAFAAMLYGAIDADALLPPALSLSMLRHFSLYFALRTQQRCADVMLLALA